ncbi:MAG TPA: adenylate/guanylate cyclase domain-containing protein [Gemmataceae bacterium]|jgi:adenylate cyclase|nr:adenylate/guanylate cyclase domain-containing protein [Gemmataceae bacterium]
MTVPAPVDPPAGGGPQDRAAAAWLADLQQELIAPVHAIRELAGMMLEDVRPAEPPALVADLHTIHAVVNHLDDLVVDLTRSLVRSPPPRPEETARRRHDARTPLHQILGYCDLWLDEADATDAPAVDRHRSDLEQLRAVGRELLARLDALREFGPPPASTPSGGDMPSAVRAWVDTSPATHPPIAPGRLLIVDDNAFNRDVLGRRLRRQGHEVAEAANGPAALDRLQSEDFDVVLLDVLMPEMSGLEVLCRLRANDRLRHLPVIMISALTEIESVARCLEAGADDFLPRPYNSVILKARIDALLERKRLLDREQDYLRRIKTEKERADALLHVILPAEAIHELQLSGRVAPRRYESVAVLFADVVGFTPYCDTHSAEEVVSHLQRLVERFEEAALASGVQKIKTIGDAFMAAAGLLRPAPNPVVSCIRCGQGIIAAARGLPPHWQVRVGVHVGPLMGGVVGSRQYLFDVWGATVNTAARLESHGEPDAITLSREAWQQVADIGRGTSRGVVEVKGKGAMELIRFDGFVMDQ